MSLENRLRKLEGGKGAPCEECGFTGSWQGVKYDIVWHHGEEDEDEGPSETQYCGTCGRPVHIVLTWGD